MTSSRNKERKQKLLSNAKKQRLKYIAILPSLITLLNGVFGFAAIVFASKESTQIIFRHQEYNKFVCAGFMIFFAMLADMLDGRIARMSHTTSSFGGQLDSLCDMISFGLAPAFIVLKVLEHYTEITAMPFEGSFKGRFIWIAAALYVACAAIRLARFNVENEEDESNHDSFIGLPSPSAAGLLIGIVLFYHGVMPTTDWDKEGSLYKGTEVAIIYTLPFIMMLVGVLMISRVPFPHAVNKYLSGKKPMAYLFWALAVFGFIALCKLETAILISFSGFVINGVARWCWKTFVKRNSKQESIEPPVVSVTSSDDTPND